MFSVFPQIKRKQQKKSLLKPHDLPNELQQAMTEACQSLLAPSRQTNTANMVWTEINFKGITKNSLFWIWLYFLIDFSLKLECYSILYKFIYYILLEIAIHITFRNPNTNVIFLT